MEEIYLDNAATTKPSVAAIEEASIFNTIYFYNTSALYKKGLETNNYLKGYRDNVAKLFGSNFDVIFTSCGSESDNTAVFSYLRRGNGVTSNGEHSAVFNPFLEVKNRGIESRFCEVDKHGYVKEDSLLSLIDSNTTFVSIVHVNSETGAINDINRLAKLCKEKNPKLIFHSDGVQAFGKIPFKPSKDIDLYSCSAHKINGLKGVGALFINKKLNNLKPLIFGGGQENGLRSGTSNVFGISVFNYVTESHYKTINEDYKYVEGLKKEFLSNLDLNEFILISDDNCSPYIVCLSASGLRGEVIQHILENDGIIIGKGSACSSKKRYSRMLQSTNSYSNDDLDGVIRISFSRDNTIEEVKYASEVLNKRVKEFREKMK